MNIAILGFGTVGGGVYSLLRDGKLGIHVRRVLDIRPIEGLENLLTDNIADIVADPQIDCVVETIGGMHPALNYVTMALRAGKSVVTSNKELVSQAIAPLTEGAAMHNAQIRCGASVGGGVPWIDNLFRQKRIDTILSLDGIVNGTTNFILDAMHKGAQFSRALEQAREMGYAEADASADLEGLDAQRKCAISAAVAFDIIIEPEDIPVAGIASIRPSDIEAFAGEGLVCKSIMCAARTEGGISAYVEPVLFSLGRMEAHTPTNHNFISLRGRHCGHLAFYGEGAGRFPTAVNILRDLQDLAGGGKMPGRNVQPAAVENAAVAHPYYLRTVSRHARLAEVTERAWGEGVLTRRMSVSEMHTLSMELRDEDPYTFLAGVCEN